MANSITKDVAIYRCTNTGDTESNLADTEAVGMDYGMPDTAAIGVTYYDWKIINRKPDVPQPENRGISKPDTGLQSVQVYIGIKFNEKVSDNTKIGYLTKWGLQAQTVRSSFPKGRFGLRNNKKPYMNFQPTNQSGYKIDSGDFNDVIEYGGLFDTLIVLEFGGLTSELVATLGGSL